MVRKHQILKCNIRLYLIFIASVLLQGCSAGVAPNEEEIIGIWISSDGAELNFNLDGTFIGKSLPTELLHAPDVSGEFFDCKGNWLIKQERKGWDQLPWYISLQLENSPTEYISAVYLKLSGSNFLENSPPWKYLFFWLEEGGQRYKFKKQQ